jgi:hypothetical protein
MVARLKQLDPRPYKSGARKPGPSCGLKTLRQQIVKTHPESHVES